MPNDYNLGKRTLVIGGLVVTVLLIYIFRLLNLQVIDSTKYKDEAALNAFRDTPIFPPRGLIYDREGRLLVDNEPAYELVVTMRDVQDDLDTHDLCRRLKITQEQFDERIAAIKRGRGYSRYTQQIFATQLSGADAGLLREKLHDYPGFDIRDRTIRQYKYAIAPHILGNIREVSARELERDTAKQYRMGEFTGDLGVEKSYDQVLRGVKGRKVVLKDAHGLAKGPYEEGRLDVQPVPGRNLTLSIDAELQAYAESLMVSKVGAVVAIEPKTGEILCMVSAPTFDPRLLVGRDRGKNYRKLLNDPYKPLFDRAVSASYPPGSTFKPTQGLIALQEGVITPQTSYPCSHGYRVAGFKMGCHGHSSPLPLVPALATSCNAYFAAAFRAVIDNRKKYPTIQEAFNSWKDYLVSMGYGYKLGVDIPGETRGFIPNAGSYDKWFRTPKWKSLNIVSVSIGQGEILATPLQIANLGATIANRGHYYTPHVVRAIQDSILPADLYEPHRTNIDRRHYDAIVQGMRGAVTGGTCTKANLDALGIAVCGKTGTAQNPHGKDHSVFMGFAPMDDPQIAICVYVENGIWGATYGVPIGSLVMERYLTGATSPARKYLEESMLNSSTLGNMNITKSSN